MNIFQWIFLVLRIFSNKNKTITLNTIQYIILTYLHNILSTIFWIFSYFYIHLLNWIQNKTHFHYFCMKNIYKYSFFKFIFVCWHWIFYFFVAIEQLNDFWQNYLSTNLTFEWYFFTFELATAFFLEFHEKQHFSNDIRHTLMLWFCSTKIHSTH